MPYLRSGDGLIIVCAVAFVLWLASRVWFGEAGDTLVVRAAGRVISELPLSRDRLATVSGPLGPTTVEVRDRRARVKADPSPRQYCVKQGWIERAGQSAICLPNQVSIEIAGRAFDSLNY